MSQWATNKSGRDIPDSDYYEDYPQLENGVGMLRSCSDEFGMALADIKDFSVSIDKSRTVSIATGVAAYPLMAERAQKLMKLCPNLTVNIYEITNNFFGRSITVSGLLTGRDMYEQLLDKPLGDMPEIVIPLTFWQKIAEYFKNLFSFIFGK